MDRDLTVQLNRYSAKWGADPDLVQGAGGNVSVKDGETLLVKASGMRLGQALEKNILVDLPLAAAKAMADGMAAPDRGGLRASIETSLHAVMPHRFVAHLHAIDVLAFATRTDGESVLAERLQGLPWVWIDYVKPGMLVAQRVRRALAEVDADIFVLGSHGIVIGGDSAEAVDLMLAKLLRRVAGQRREVQLDFDRIAQVGAQYGLAPARIEVAHQAAMDPASLSMATAGSLYPDHVVFLGRGAQRLVRTPSADDASLLYLAPGVGAFLTPGLPEEAHEMAACLGAVVTRIASGAPLKTLTRAEEDELLQWDAEKYRRSLAQQDSSGQRG